ncbi:hypothetical protein EON62_05425 [archaeon]|nr:MAG: hypothetical protein EON62_05425 [archaeon]
MLVTPCRYFENRSRAITTWEAAGVSAYPHKFHVEMRLPEFVAAYADTEVGTTRDDVVVAVAGRLMSSRSSSSKLQFYDLHSEGAKVQIMYNMAAAEEVAAYEWTRDNVRRGDIVGVVGSPCKTKKGEFSIVPKRLTILSPCLHQIPKSHFGLKDQETRYRQRYLDIMLSDTTRDVFVKRAKIINYIRRFLDSRHFLEVETPMMNMLPGGAAARYVCNVRLCDCARARARVVLHVFHPLHLAPCPARCSPFVTYHNDLSMDLFMRIAPELYLKQLVIGGFDRVYELGRQFRNEGIDLTHNPEFTTVEFYMAYADYNDLMDMMEEMLSGMVMEMRLKGGVKSTSFTGLPSPSPSGWYLIL